MMEEIKEEIKSSQKQMTMNTQDLWGAVKAVLRGKFIANQSNLKKQEKS